MEKTIRKGTIDGTVHPPSSKSYAQRTLAGALLTEGETIADNIQLCDDTYHALAAIQSLGAKVARIDAHTYSISGGLAPVSDTVNTGESGLATRLFTPIAALSDRRITITGKGSMLRRPIGMMIKPLQNLGVEVESDGFLPISVKGPIRGGETEVDGYVSSQFLTGLLMALPLAAESTTLYVEHPNSIPYLAMTVDVAEKFGIRIDHNDYHEFFIPAGQRYTPGRHLIEGDWSSAAFMLAAGAIAGKVTLGNMNSMSLQADVKIIDVLSHAGAEIVTSTNEVSAGRHALRAFDFDATHCPDLFPVLAVLAANCEGTSRIHGTSRLIHKESDRAAAIVSEFTKLGIKVSIEANVMTVRGGKIRGGVIDSCNDHRIAMAGAVAGLSSEKPVTVKRAEAVTKSYPGFWKDLESITKR